MEEDIFAIAILGETRLKKSKCGFYVAMEMLWSGNCISKVKKYFIVVG